ncbi:hypothetical protein MALG_01722 [Marinovum algicola DG 898]|nr:hypothetical protein MALG_01722 [Marinovum algicola DG 898]
MTFGEFFSGIGTFIASVPNLLPITVLSALLLFFAKEVLEGFRRRRATSRKRKAMRRLLKDELERNKWALRSLHDCVNTLEGMAHRPGSVLIIKTNPLGGRSMRREGKESGDYSEHPVPKIHSYFLKGNILEIALIDREIFELALEGIDAIAEMEHILKGILEYSEDREAPFLEGFAEYAHNELNDSEKALAALYTKITGKPYEEFRLR